MIMEIKELRCFVQVAQTLNFNRAAGQLNVSQSVVTKTVAQLEHKLGIKLFERTTRRVALTCAGLVLQREACSLLDHFDRVQRAVRHEIGTQNGRLTIGVTPLAMQTAFPQIYRGFRDRHPTIDVSIQELPTDVQLKALLAAEIDVGFLLAPASHPLLEVKVIHEQVMRLAVPSNHLLLQHFDAEAIPLASFAAETFIIPSRNHHPGVHDEIMRACSTAGFRPRIQECQESQSCVSLVQAGIGVTFVSGSLPPELEPDIQIVELQPPVPVLTVAVAWRLDDTSPLLSTICKLSSVRPL